jgi:hypothetical protein
VPGREFYLLTGLHKCITSNSIRATKYMTLLKFIFGCSLAIFLYSFITPTFDWYKYQDKDCEILFPKAPKNDTIIKETSVGKIVYNLHILKGELTENDSNLVYELLETTYPSDDLLNATKEIAESAFEGAVNSSLKQLNGNLVSEKDINPGGYYGKEVKISFDKDTKLVRMRCYLAKGKFYVVETVTPSDKELNSSAVTFFESFKIK